MADSKKNIKAPARDEDREFQDFHGVDLKQNIALILEDSFPHKNILRGLLNNLGFEVIATANGVEGEKALKYLEKKNATLQLVISDLMMPKIDGLEFLRILRAHGKFSKTPFIFATAVNSRTEIVEAGKYGVSGYILKPVTLQQLKEKLSALFPKHSFVPVHKRKNAG